MQINAATLEEALKVLADRGDYFEIVVIGGGSLLLLGQIERPTKDLDMVAVMDTGRLISAYPVPVNLSQAAKEGGMALGRVPKSWKRLVKSWPYIFVRNRITS